MLMIDGIAVIAIATNTPLLCHGVSGEEDLVKASGTGQAKGVDDSSR